MQQQAFLVELNEVCFNYVAEYCARGLLPTFRRLLDNHGLVTTISEQRADHLEPWIQWVTAHTGLSLRQHGVHRLGDIVERDIPQIWETLEEQGLSVGAISPMNAKHRLRNPAFFVPDPWTSTRASGPKTLIQLYGAIAQAVNDNAHARLTPKSFFALVRGLLTYSRLDSCGEYVALATRSRSCPWRRAILLDRLLADVFIHEVRRTEPNFASLFLNAAAHIQHHYMFCSPCYNGDRRNPSWYVPAGLDPLREIYETYDRILRDILHLFPRARLMIATGLRQVPHSDITYYWRLKDHADFLRSIGVEFERVEPRMSRDFVVKFANHDAAAVGAKRLSRAVASDGSSLFEVDNRGQDLFAMLTYSKEIAKGFAFTIEGRCFQNFNEKVAFVALKNGEHDGTGYFVDTGMQRESAATEIFLSDIPSWIARAFDLTFSSPIPMESTMCNRTEASPALRGAPQVRALDL